jgi:AbrB family looped-hinge helix DNA binding protein
MSSATVSSKFQIVIPSEVRRKLNVIPQQRFHVIEKGGIITLIPEVRLKALKGVIPGIDRKGVREKKDRV